MFLCVTENDTLLTVVNDMSLCVIYIVYYEFQTNIEYEFLGCFSGHYNRR